MRDLKPRQLRTLASLSAFCFSGAQSLTVALYPLLAERLGLSLASLIASFSLGSFLFVFGSPFWAQKSDRIGRLRVLTYGLGALFASFALLSALVWNPFATSELNLIVLVASRLVYGLVASAIAPVSQALQADLAEESSSAKAMLLHTLSLNIGRVVGVSFVLVFAGQMAAILPSFLALIALVFLSVVISTRLSNRVTLMRAPAERAPIDFANLKWVLAIAFVFSAFAEAMNSSLGGNLKHFFSLDAQATSQLAARLLLFASLGIVAVQILTRFFSKLPLRAGLGIGVGALILGSAVFAGLDSHAELWIAMSLFVIGAGLVPPFYLSLLRRNCPASQYGARAGWVGSAHTVGFALGGGLAALVFRTGLPQTGGLLILISVVLSLTAVGALR